MNRNDFVIVASFLAIASGSTSVSLAAKFVFGPIAEAGQFAPGAGPGVVFANFPTNNGATIANNGDVAFTAKLAQEAITVSALNDDGIWAGGGVNPLALVAREFDLAPGGNPGDRYDQLFRADIDNVGGVAFGGTLLGPSVNNSNQQAIWSGPVGGTSLIARTGSTAPGAGTGATFVDNASFRLPTHSDAGHVSFSADAFIPGPNSTRNGKWVGLPGSLQKIVLVNDPAPTVGAGVQYGIVGSTQSAPVNSSGRISFSGLVFGGSTTSGNDEGLWTAVSSPSQTLKIREGNATGISQVNFGQPLPYTDSINGLGDTLSGVNLAGSGAPNGTKQSLWANTGGALQLITREGALAHDSAPLTFYRQVFYPSVINDALDVAYFAGIDGNETGVGLWTGNISGGTPSGQMSSAPMRIALNGEQAAGLPAGVIYDQLDTGNTGNGMGLNGLGSVLFSGRLNGPGVTGSNDFAIWLYEKEWDQVFLVAREGDEIQVGPNDTRTVANFGYFGTFGQDDGRLESLNDSDQIAMTLSFTDGSSGVFVASKVPEPTSRFFALVAWISLSLVARRPRRGRPLSANDRDP